MLHAKNGSELCNFTHLNNMCSSGCSSDLISCCRLNGPLVRAGHSEPHWCYTVHSVTHESISKGTQASLKLAALARAHERSAHARTFIQRGQHIEVLYSHLSTAVAKATEVIVIQLVTVDTAVAQSVGNLFYVLAANALNSAIFTVSFLQLLLLLLLLH
jgi:hypothetical protein